MTKSATDTIGHLAIFFKAEETVTVGACNDDTPAFPAISFQARARAAAFFPS